METDSVWIPLTPGKSPLTCEQGMEKETVNDGFSCTGYFIASRCMGKCVMNEKCEYPAGVVDNVEEVVGVAGKDPKVFTTVVQDDKSSVQEETVKISPSEHNSTKDHGVNESQEGIGSIPTPSKTEGTRKRRNDGNDINKKPSQRPRMKKHRPKIFDDSKPKKVPKAKTSRARASRPNTPMPATPNWGYERKMQSRTNNFSTSTNCMQKSTDFGFEDAQEASRALIDVGACKRLDFDCEEPPNDGFISEKFDFFHGKIVTSKRNTLRRSKFQNKSLEACDNLFGDDNKQKHSQDISVTRNKEHEDKNDRRYVYVYQRRKKVCSNSTGIPTLQVYHRRVIKGNECLHYSKKCEPIFPKLFKKYRTMRKKVKIKVNHWYIVADELRKILVKKSHTRKKVQNRVNKSKNKKGVVKRRNLYVDEILPLFLQQRRKRSMMHTRKRESITEFSYDLQNSLLCHEDNFLQMTEVPVQRIRSFTSPYMNFKFPPFDDYFGTLKWLQPQDVVVFGSLPHEQENILHTKEDKFNASEVEHLIGKIASLDINDQCKELMVRNQSVSGALVQVLPPKKRKVIPKVNLDDETLRVWKLLMENDESEPTTEETNKDKEEWWETQRSIFRGRVDSFIAKMHLIQGNRRFSPWKGSVIDSVVGVYLTQNVSDHLSSSAFMSVAARFPPEYRSKEVDDNFEVPNSQESVASNTQIYEANNVEQEMSASYVDVRDATPVMGPNQNPVEVQDNPCNDENDTSFRKLLEVEEVEFLKQFCKAGTDELGSIEGEEQSASVHNFPKVVNPSCSLQSEVTVDKETPLENNLTGQKINRKEKKQETETDWEKLRKTYYKTGEKETDLNHKDAVNWDAVRTASVAEIAQIIVDRGMHNVQAERIKECLDRIYKDHGTLDLEWLRDVPPDKAKEFLLSIRGLGLKSVECVRLLTLHHNAFPVDTNVGRVATRLGWVPLQPLPDSVQIHLLNAYPMVDNIQKYLYPRLCTLDQKTLYELHYQLITFGKVFCTKRNPNCNACPMRAECRHYASAFASGRLALPGSDSTKESSHVTSIVPAVNEENHSMHGEPPSSFDLEVNNSGSSYQGQNQTCEPIIEVPPSPEPEVESIIGDIEDLCYASDDDDEIPTIRLNTQEFKETLKETIDTNNISVQEADVSKALIAFSAEASSSNMRAPPKKFVAKSRTMHLVYELPDFHPILAGFEKREHDDPTPYLLAVWFPGEIPNSLEYTKNRAHVAANDDLEETVKATVLIPCRTATRGTFPLNGTYFQVNEVFADDETSHSPMDVPRRMLCNLPLRELGCGTSATSIFKDLSTGAIQRLFWRGSICVRGFNRSTRLPRHLHRMFHISTTAIAAEIRKSRKR